MRIGLAIEWIRGSSQYIIGFVRAVILLFIGFKWVILEDPQVQMALLMGAVESFFAMVTAKTTVSHTRMDTIVENRVQDIMSAPNDPTTRERK